MQPDIERVLISREQIADRLDELADDVARLPRNADGELLIVCVLSGAIVFVADLIRRLPMKMRIGLVTVSSYTGKTTESRGPSMPHPFRVDARGRDVLIVDDILDTGRTLRLVQAVLASQKPASLHTCVLLRKLGVERSDVEADLVGFDIENVFVVGYGLDYDGHYRNLPDIAVLKSHLYDR